MDKNRLWIICSVLVMALVVAGGWFVGVQPQLAAIADAESQTASVQQTNDTYAQALAKLKKDSEDLPALKAKLASLAASVPEGSDIPAFIDQLNALYTASNVVCVDQAFSDAVAYSPVAPPAAAPASTPAPTSGATPAPTPTPAPTAAGVPPVVSSLITATNFAARPVSVTVRGQYGDILNFVSGLQSGARLFLVTSFSTVLAADTAAPAGTLDAKVSGYVFSLTPEGQDGGAPATPGTSTDAPAQASK
ncbi:type 4a pilus biogenesis protein PilO [Leifsonia aquatica]|uniref:type 4a pilus biogenesis protein PilO n=1 Tax=Leifsonia aquatica TaxID=144185 RepID=UPI00384B3AD7